MAQNNMESQSEQEIQFKKRARRRLVGAVALVLLMIILLPMLLEDRVAQTPKEEVVISIPSQDSQLDTKSNSTPEKVTDVAQQTASQVPTLETTPPPVAAPVAQVKTPEVKPAEPPAPVAQNEKPIVKPVDMAPVQELKPAPKEQEKPKADKPASKGKFYVQVGVFSNPSKVEQLQTKLSENALKSSTEVIDTPKGTKTRLRVGMFSSKAEAEAALLKVKALGLTDAVIGN